MSFQKSYTMALPLLFLEVQTAEQIQICLQTARQISSALPVEKRFGFISPVNAAGQLGVEWWVRLIEDHAPAHAKANTHIIDCGSHAGWALQALRTGIKNLILYKSCPQFTLVEDRAWQCGCQLVAVRPPLLEISDISSVSLLSNALHNAD